MIQVFPDEFHIRTLEQMLSAYARALPSAPELEVWEVTGRMDVWQAQIHTERCSY